MAEKRKYRTYKKYQVVYADLGYRGPGVQGMLRPCIVVSRNESNHAYAPQVNIDVLFVFLHKRGAEGNVY